MPARHHRTVDRTVAIMEVASRATSGVTLAELAARLQAPKSSIQELTNGLLATGYLVERDRRFQLGPGAFVLSLHTAGLPLRQVKHEELERAQERVGTTLFVGARLGDDQPLQPPKGIDVGHHDRPLQTVETFLQPGKPAPHRTLHRLQHADI